METAKRFNLDWDKLRIFHTVAQAGSFTKAGDVLNLSQSAVSRQISNLEDSIGVSLFHRHARGLVLTEQGDILYDATQDVSKKLNAIQNELEDSQNSEEGALKITTAEFIGSTWLAPKMPFLRERYPKMQISILVNDQILDLSLREADAAIRLQRPKQDDLIQRHLTKVHFRICGSRSYFKKYGYPKTKKDLKNHTLIGYPPNAVEPFTEPNWIFRVAGLNPAYDSNILMMNSMYAIHRAVEAGAGIAALPDYLISESSALEIILEDVKRPGVDMFFVYPKERKNSKRLELFRDFLMEHIQKTNF